MGTFRRNNITMIAIATILAIFAAQPSVSRSVNISSSWLLPQNDFPVFYRHFRDRVTWFEADAVCQFHHAQLATVESNSQFEAIRSYLKELDVTENVWIGLKRNSEASEFTWTNYQPLARSGYFREEVQRSLDPVCVVTDPTANFKWHSLHCGGPEVASFVCELPVPYWASKSNGCMTSTMEGMTVTFLPERPAIQLTKECSPGVSKNVTCNGNMKQSEILEQLTCPNKLLMTLIKTYNPIITDVKFRTTTSSSEADIEDYAIEMATIYNDETIQSISKAMERSADGLGNLPQEMSIAQEPIKLPGRNIFDTNGIDSAFHRSIDRTATSTSTPLAPAITTTTTTTTTTRIPSTTSGHTTTDRTATSSTTTGRTTIGRTTTTTTTNNNTTSTTTTSLPSTIDAVTTSTVVTGTRTQPKRTALDADIAYAVTVASRPSPQTVANNVTTSAASTSATTTDTGKLTAVHAATEVPPTSSSSTVVKVVSTSTGQPTIALNSPIATATVTTSTSTTRRIGSTTTTTTVGNGGHHNHHHHFSSTTAKSPVTEMFPIVAEKIPTTQKIPTTEKIPTPQKVQAPSISTAGIPVANASTVIAVTRPPVTSTVKIPYTVATARIPTAAKATIQMPTIHVYKKIELPPMATDSSSGHEDFPYKTANHTGAARKPSETATGTTVITTGSTAMNSTATATGSVVKTATVVAAQPTATTTRASVTIASAAPNNETSATTSGVSGSALDDNAWNPTPSSPPSTTAVDTAASVTDTAAASATDASATDTTTAAATATDTPATAAASAAAAITSYPPFTSPSSATIPPPASPLSTSSATAAAATAATATAATATSTTTTTAATSTTTVATNHRKASSYDAYTDHPNRSRHIIRPKQHHHSYPYILYRLLG